MATGELSGSRTLFVFDFDHTLVDDNTDTWILSISPELNLKENLRSLRERNSSWTDLMDHVFSLISGNGCTKEDVEKHMRKLRLYDQALKAVRAVYESQNADSIVLSDSNTVFIDLILEECEVKHMFKDVITNPAYFEPNGRLRVQHYHSHGCETCASSSNLCKGEVLKNYLSLHPLYGRVVYVGDGGGDYCPVVGLNGRDIAISREGYTLAKKLKKMTAQSCRGTVYTVDFVKCLGDFIIANCIENP